MIRCAARRERNRYMLEGVIVPCMRDYPDASAARASFLVDTGAAVTMIPPATAPVAALAFDQRVRLANDAVVPAARVRVHLVIARQHVTVDAWVVDGAGEALIGVDLLRRLDLSGERAEVVLARTDEVAVSAGVSQLGAAIDRLNVAIEKMTVQSCDCQLAIDTLIARGKL